MNSYIRHFILTVVMALCATAAAYSQNNIDRVIEKLESDPKCKTTFYLESRDTKTHKVRSLDRTMEITDQAIAKRITEAFQKDRPSSFSYSKQSGLGRNKNKYSSTIKFYSENDTKYSTYILTYNGNNNWVLVVKKSMVEKAKTKTTGTRNRHNKKVSSYELPPYDIEYQVIEI
ncbi:MAG: DUF5024 domain-containing protein [Duncaniella sp.]|nr:DUF5024 domain-containing protein [Duncaniella sp.]